MLTYYPITTCICKVITAIDLHYQTKECQRGAKRMKGNDAVIDIRESIIFVGPRRTWM